MTESTRGQRGSFGSGKHITFHQSLFDGEAHLYKLTQSGEVYQFSINFFNSYSSNNNYSKYISLQNYER